MGDWIAFWDSKHSIYVNARHRDVHYRTIAQDVRAHAAGAAVLDYGCGEAPADMLAATARTLILCDAAPQVRTALAARSAGNPKIEVRSPEEVAALPAGALDVIIMHSVAQYLTPPELDALLQLFRRLLTDKGVLVLGDVLPPNVSAFTDAMALIRFAAANGFLAAALVGLCRTALSDYWRLRSTLGLTRYGEAAMVEKLAAAGFSASRAAANIGHNPARMTFLARPTGVDSSTNLVTGSQTAASGSASPSVNRFGSIEILARWRVATQRPCVLHPGSIPAGPAFAVAASAGKPAEYLMRSSEGCPRELQRRRVTRPDPAGDDPRSAGLVAPQERREVVGRAAAEPFWACAW